MGYKTYRTHHILMKVIRIYISKSNRLEKLVGVENHYKSKLLLRILEILIYTRHNSRGKLKLIV